MWEEGSGKMNSLDFAIKMEQDGEQYYKSQAELNKDNHLYSVCMMLAKDEARHAALLDRIQNQKSYNLVDNDTIGHVKNVFADLGDIKSEIKDYPSQLDFYRTALAREEDSIKLYTELLEKAGSAPDKMVFEYLIKQEKQHYETFEWLVTMLLNAEEWVESAEFGLRKDY